MDSPSCECSAVICVLWRAGSWGQGCPQLLALPASDIPGNMHLAGEAQRWAFPDPGPACAQSLLHQPKQERKFQPKHKQMFIVKHDSGSLELLGSRVSALGGDNGAEGMN